MKKVIMVFITLFFCNIISAQEDIIVKSEIVDTVVVDSNDKHSKLYFKIKNNKYLKYGIITVGTLVCLGGAVCSIRQSSNKRGNYGA